MMKLLCKGSLSKKSTLLLWMLGISFALKIAYSLRNPLALFNSGPDANGYIPFAISFKENNFLSSDVEGPPYYPSGYPYLASRLIIVSESNWIFHAQILQIFAFTIASLWYFRMIEKFLSPRVAWISTVFLAFNPAWAVVNGEAMYETTLLFFFIFSLWLWQRESLSHGLLNKCKALFSGLLAGYTIVVHPRIIPIYAIIVLFMLFTKRFSRNDLLTLFFTAPIFPMIFSFRNFVAEREFTLMSSFWAGVSWNDFLTGCKSIHCVLQKIHENEVGFLASSLRQAIEFWSPHSGPLMRGTWYHNISLLSQFNSLGFIKAAIYMSVIVSILTFLFWIVGTLYLYKQNKTISLALFLTVLAIWFTDILVYPDNRHRLIALVFMLPAQAALIDTMLAKYYVLSIKDSVLRKLKKARY